MDKSSAHFSGLMQGAKTWVVALIAVGAFLAQARPASSMLPFYAQDWNTRFGTWNGADFQLSTPHNIPELARLVSEHAELYGENANLDGDATYFASLPVNLRPTHLMHYLGFGGSWYEGPAEWLDENHLVQLTEGNFYHSMDPSSITAWRRSDGVVEVHWTPDLRHALNRQDMQYLDRPMELAARDLVVTNYVVDRKDLASGTVTSYGIQVVVNASSWLDPEAFMFEDTSPPSGRCTYSIRSLSPVDATIRPFTDVPDTVEAGVGDRPRFWALKSDYEERHYARLQIDTLTSGPFTHEMHFCVDRNIDPALLTIERITRSHPDLISVPEKDEYQLGSGLSYSFNAGTGIGTIVCTINTDTSYLKSFGGVAYRVRYQAPGGDIYYPDTATDGGFVRPQFVWSTVNNRIMGCTWSSYMMNCEGFNWRNTIISLANHLGSGSAQPYPPNLYSVRYDRVFLDSAMAITVDGSDVSIATHNRIRPVEYRSAAACQDSVVDRVKEICIGAPGVGFMINTGNVRFVDAFTSSNGIVHNGIVGFMDENIQNSDQYWSAVKLANLIWKFRGHTYEQNLVTIESDFGIAQADRLQTVCAYLISRDPFQTQQVEPSSLFGYHDWRHDGAPSEPFLPIMPEQMLTVLDTWNGADPFAGVNWLAGSGTTPYAQNGAAASAWLGAIAPAIREFGVIVESCG